MPRVPKPFPLTMAAASPLPDIGPRGGGDDGTRGGGDAESECSTTWQTNQSCAESNASAILGDTDADVAIATRPIVLKPAPGLSCGCETQDGVMEDSDQQEQRGTPEMVDISPVWLNQFLAEYRISARLPNRKFKVPRAILAERLEIFWISVAKVRKLILLHFGYDPDCRNIDQSPFHSNEAGSKACNTLALTGALTVPLIENHAATRARWSLNSVTFSSEERIRRRLPGFELMFQAEGHVLEEHLQM